MAVILPTTRIRMRFMKTLLSREPLQGHARPIGLLEAVTTPQCRRNVAANFGHTSGALMAHSRENRIRGHIRHHVRHSRDEYSRGKLPVWGCTVRKIIRSEVPGPARSANATS